MKDFIHFLTGNIQIAMFWALFFFAALGVTINLLLHASARDQQSPDTPVKFSLRFLLYDNWKRILLSVLLIYVTIRFASTIFVLTLDGNNELYLFVAVLIGFGYDKLAELIKKKGTLLKVRE